MVRLADGGFVAQQEGLHLEGGQGPGYTIAETFRQLVEVMKTNSDLCLRERSLAEMAWLPLHWLVAPHVAGRFECDIIKSNLI